MAEALIGLGGNVGDVRATLDRAVEAFCDGREVRLIARSSDYRTPPWGVEEQPPFVNLCLRVETSLSPQALLRRAQYIEQDLGRDRATEQRWGPRPVDIDILAYDDLGLDEPDLVLPHPRLFERAFVLVPLAELAPELMITGIKVKDALARLDTGGIEKLPPGSPPDVKAKLRIGWIVGPWHFCPMTDDLKLGAEFPAATREQWVKLVEGVLKGQPFDKNLVSRTYDGLAIPPLYDRAAAARPIPGRAAAPWQVMQRVDHPDPAAANAQALEDLENGATGLILVSAGSVSANGYGLDATPETLAQVLDGLVLDAGIAIDFNLSPPTRDAARHFAALVKSRKLAPSSVDMRASINPIGGFAASGTSPRPWGSLAQSFAGMVRELADQGFRGPFAVADGRIIHNAGGSEAQELAFAIASAVEYMRALEKGGVALDAARGMIYFRLSADADQFLTIAKFRALRKLWARIEEACGLAPKPAHVAAETAWRMMTRRDSYVNMLRTTVAVAAAGLGGADSITVLPHTAALGLPDAFARRIARNTQLILLEESNLAKVADPAAGSGGLEDLTQQLCGTAWSLFQEIEAAGGAWTALERGVVQAKVAAVRAQRQQAIAMRKDALTGTTDYPDLDEAPPAVLDVAGIVAPKETAVAVTTEALPRIRLAEPFEELRDASDAILARTGSRPKVFLANLGPLSAFITRATFAKNFFETGGIEAVTNDGFQSHADMAAAFRASGAKLACLCASDELYAREAVEAARTLRDAGPAHMYLAGRPGDLEGKLKAAGVGTFVFVDCDALAILRAAYDIIQRYNSRMS